MPAIVLFASASYLEFLLTEHHAPGSIAQLLYLLRISSCAEALGQFSKKALSRCFATSDGASLRLTVSVIPLPPSAIVESLT